jgi:hypothetical protein
LPPLLRLYLPTPGEVDGVVGGQVHSAARGRDELRPCVSAELDADRSARDSPCTR